MLRRRPTVPAVADVLEADLDRMGVGDVHVLGVSLVARIALELARRHRARSVVAISPSGMNLPPERLHQGVALAATRLFWRRLRPVIGPLAHSPVGDGRASPAPHRPTRTAGSASAEDAA